MYDCITNPNTAVTYIFQVKVKLKYTYDSEYWNDHGSQDRAVCINFHLWLIGGCFIFHVKKTILFKISSY